MMISPLEKVAMAYDLVKSFYYKEYETKHTMKSRHITQIVNDEYIVCIGFVNIFNRLLSELEDFDLSITMKGESEVGHERSIIILNDKKYSINGV